MAKWAMGLGLVGWCVLCSAGCRKPEPEVPALAAVSPAPPESPPARTVAVIDLEALPVSTVATVATEPSAMPEPPRQPERLAGAGAADEETPPSQLLETDSGTWERPERRSVDTTPEDEDRAWFREAAAAAQAGDTSGSATQPLERVTIASSSVDGRVKRVRPGTIEVSDTEGNVYELRLDGRSRGLRRGRHIPLKAITEGMPVRASFDLVGDGESLARDIEVRR
jgi:hypothetical protein